MKEVGARVSARAAGAWQDYELTHPARKKLEAQVMHCERRGDTAIRSHVDSWAAAPEPAVGPGRKRLLAPLVTAVVAPGAGAISVVLDWRQRVALCPADAVDVGNFEPMGHALERVPQMRAPVFRTTSVLSAFGEAQVKATRKELA